MAVERLPGDGIQRPLLSCMRLQEVGCMDDQHFFQLKEELVLNPSCRRSTHVRYRTTMQSYHDARLCRVSTCAERAEDCLPGPRQLLLKAQMIKITFQVQQLVTQEQQEYTRC